MASLLYPVISLITTNGRLAGDFLAWMEPYAVLGRVFPSGQALLNDVDGAQTQLLVLASAASDLPLGTLLRQLRLRGEADAICLDEQGVNTHLEATALVGIVWKQPANWLHSFRYCLREDKAGSTRMFKFYNLSNVNLSNLP